MSLPWTGCEPQDPIVLGPGPCPPRRTVLQGAAGLLLAWLAPVAASAQDGRAARPAAGDWLVKVGDGSLAPLTPDDIPAAANPTMAWAMTPDTQRREERLAIEPHPAGAARSRRARGADPRPCSRGRGGLFRHLHAHGMRGRAWLADEQQLYCECHQSKFDPRDRRA